MKTRECPACGTPTQGGRIYDRNNYHLFEVTYTKRQGRIRIGIHDSNHITSTCTYHIIAEKSLQKLIKEAKT